MILCLIKHLVLGYTRSEFFGKNIVVQCLVLLAALVTGYYIYFLGASLPFILLEHYPQSHPAEWIFSSLGFIMVSDLLLRFGFQKLPMSFFTPYLHLPLSKWHPSFIWAVRSLFHPVNFYLPIFFWAFIRQTINPEMYYQWLGICGIILLSLLNHHLYLSMKTALMARPKTGKIILTVVLIMVVLGIYHTSWFMEISYNLFFGFLEGNVYQFIIVTAFITGFLLWAVTNVREGRYGYKDYYKIVRNTQNKGLSDVIGSLHPIYGTYWWLEWKLLTRNRRTRTNFWLFPVFSLAALLYINYIGLDQIYMYAWALLIIGAGYGASHLQNALSWESHFFDFLTTRHFSMYHFLMSKYYFYVFLAVIQLLIVAVFSVVLNNSLILIYTPFFLYSTGVGFYVYFRMSINNSGRLDPNGTSSFNVEGLSSTRFIITILLFFSIAPFLVINQFSSIPGLGLWLMGGVGAYFILLHRNWIYSFSNRLEFQKHRNLSIYRNK